MSVLPPHEVALEIDGLGYLGWTEIAIERAIDAMVGSFELTLAAKDRTGAEDWQIEDGAACRVLLGGEVLITGYVDSVTRLLDEESRGIRVTGRDKAADLVDCSAIHKPGSWAGQRLEAIARALAAPFGVSIEVDGDTGAPFKRFALQQGETVFAAIDRMARYRGLVAYSPGDGTLRIGKADTGTRSGRVSEGINVKSAEATRDVSERYSDYLLKGQASGDDTRSGKAVAQVKATARDGGVRRYRPLLVIGEEQSDKASLAKRASWEASVRAGRAERLSVTVPGWLTDDGKVWAPGARSACDIPSCNVSADLLIERVRTVRDGQSGTVTELGLVPPEAWSQLPEAEEAA
jgi:prophage tail gpP-like protein